MNKFIEDNFLLNQKEKNQREIILASKPIRISMNLTGNCNIRCSYCHLSFADYYTKQEMTLENFIKLKPFLSSVKHLVYFSSTEPLFAKHFKKIFQSTNPYNAEKYFSTNGILLDERISTMLVKGELHYLTISFAGLTKEMFTKYHKVDKLQVVIDNIKQLNDIKKQYNTIFPKLRLVFVLTYENKHELSKCVELAKELSCSEGIKITYLKAYSKELKDITPYQYKEEINEYVIAAKVLAKDLEVKVSFDGDDFSELNFDEEVILHKPCLEPYERFHVEADGKVRPCVSLSCNEFAGDITTQNVEEIWNSEVYQKFRERVNTKNPPSSCLRCTHNFHKDFRREDIWDLSDMDLSIYTRKIK